MIWLSRVNAALAVLCLLLFGAWGVVIMLPRTEATMPNIIKIKASKPLNAFKQPDEAYSRIGAPWLELNFVPPTLQLPDLSKEIIYHGKNNRPDVQRDQALLHISLKSFGRAPTIQSVIPGNPIYLRYDRSLTPPRFTFAPKNQKSSLWITLEPEEDSANMTVFMLDEQGHSILEPENLHIINLPEKELPRFRNDPWEIGGNRVDAGLLARQQAKWYGQDLFLEMHGGEAFADFHNMQLIIFGEGEEQYFRFLKEGSWLIWKDNGWQKSLPDSGTWQYPLLQVRKVDDRILKFDLWDSEGKARIALNLVKSREISPLRRLQGDIHFVSARTRSQATVEIKGERISVNLKEWLLHTAEDEWIKLQTVEQIDEYVEMKLKGELLVIDSLEKRDGKQILTGHLFSAMRSEVVFVELPGDNEGMIFIEKTESEKEKHPAKDEFPPKGLSPEELNILRKQYLEEQEQNRLDGNRAKENSRFRPPEQREVPSNNRKQAPAPRELNDDEDDDDDADLESKNESRVRMRLRGMFGGVQR